MGSRRCLSFFSNTAVALRVPRALETCRERAILGVMIGTARGLLLVTLLSLCGCRSIEPDTPDFADSEVTALKAEDFQLKACLGKVLAALSLTHEGRNQNYSFRVEEQSGEVKTRIERFDLLTERIEPQGLAWDLGPVSFLFTRLDEAKAGSSLTPPTRLDEVQFPNGEQSLRFVTETSMLPQGGFREARTAQRSEGLFLLYRGTDTDEAEARGELELSFAIEGRQQLERKGQKQQALLLSFELIFNFEEAVEIAPGAPKVSQLAVSSKLWFDADTGRPLVVVQRLTGSRALVRVKVLETLGSLED